MTRVRPPDARRPVVLLGAGADAHQIAADLRRAEQAGAPLRVIGFLDDDPDASGLAADDLAALRLPGPAIGVLGPIADSARFADASFVLAVASHRNMRHRARIVDALGVPAERYQRFVHPDATVPGLARVGHGVVVLARAFVGLRADLGDHVMIGWGAHVGHDSAVGACSEVAPGAIVCGRVRIGASSYVGAGARIAPDRRVGRGALVAIGAVGLDDVADRGRVRGDPARPFRTGAGARTGRIAPDAG